MGLKNDILLHTGDRDLVGSDLFRKFVFCEDQNDRLIFIAKQGIAAVDKGKDVGPVQDG